MKQSLVVPPDVKQIACANCRCATNEVWAAPGSDGKLVIFALRCSQCQRASEVVLGVIGANTPLSELH